MYFTSYCISVCYRDIISLNNRLCIILLGLIQFYVYYYGFILLVCSILGLMVGNRILLDNTIIIGNVMDIYVLGLISIGLIMYYYVCMIG